MNRQEFYQLQTVEDRLAATEWLIDGGIDDMHNSWANWATDSPRAIEKMIHWEQLSGNSVQVGTLAKMPVCISIMWDLLNGHLVAWWEPTSQVVDHRLIEKWLKQHFNKTHGGRPAICNAANFHHCIELIGRTPIGKPPMADPAWMQVAADYLKEHWDPAQETDDLLYYLPALPIQTVNTLPYWRNRHMRANAWSYLRFSSQQLLHMRGFIPADLQWFESHMRRKETTLVNWD